MKYQEPRVITLALSAVQNAQVNAFLQPQVEEPIGGGGCACQCQCQCQGQ